MPIPTFEHLCQLQHGLVSTKQLVSSGVNRELMRSWERSGRIQRVYRGVYRAVGSPYTQETEILAAVMASPIGAVASHTSALYLHGLTKEPPAVHVTVPSGKHGEGKPFAIHKSFLPRSHTIVINKIPATSVERAVIDAASFMTYRDLARLLDEVIATQKSSAQKILKVLNEYGGRGIDGVKALRGLLDERLPLSAGAQSVLELRFLKLIKRSGLPQPLTQYPIRVSGRQYILDAVWLEHGLVVELDGYGVHGTSRKRFDDDRERNNALASVPLTVLHFTARMADATILGALKPYFLAN